MVSWIWSLLTTPVLGSPECEWLLWWAEFSSCWWCLSLALQWVSNFCGELDLVPAHDTCPWLPSKLVASMVSWILTLLMMPFLGSLGSEWLLWWAGFLLTMPVLYSPGSEWLLWWAEFGSCWWHLSSALQRVSGFHGELYLVPADGACPLLSRKWVASVLSCILHPNQSIIHFSECGCPLFSCLSSLLITPIIVPFSMWVFFIQFANNIDSWLFRLFVLSEYWFGHASDFMTS